MTAKESQETQIALIRQDVSYMKGKLNDVDGKLNSHYVTKEEFEPIKRGFYWLVGTIMFIVVGAIVSLVVAGKPSG